MDHYFLGLFVTFLAVDPCCSKCHLFLCGRFSRRLVPGMLAFEGRGFLLLLFVFLQEITRSINTLLDGAMLSTWPLKLFFTLRPPHPSEKLQTRVHDVPVSGKV